MNKQNTTAATTGKTFTKVVFLMAQNPDTDRWEPMAYFPDLYVGAENAAIFHGENEMMPCCEAFALLDCRAANNHEKNAVARLKKEIEGNGFVLEVMDTAEWIKGKAERRRVIDRNVYEMTMKDDSEKMLAANKANGAARRAAA